MSDKIALHIELSPPRLLIGATSTITVVLRLEVTEDISPSEELRVQVWSPFSADFGDIDTDTLVLDETSVAGGKGSDDKQIRLTAHDVANRLRSRGAKLTPQPTKTVHFQAKVLSMGGSVIKSIAVPLELHPPHQVPLLYNQWIFNNQRAGGVIGVHWMGVQMLKAPADLMIYQDIIFRNQYSFVVEFGALRGGSALFFASILRLIHPAHHKVLSIDIDPKLDEIVRQQPDIEIMKMSSTSSPVEERIASLRPQFEGGMVVVVDSSHSAAHVFDELELLHRVVRPGDYIIVEDGVVVGYPVQDLGMMADPGLPSWGGGPIGALKKFLYLHPGEYRFDYNRFQYQQSGLADEWDGYSAYGITQAPFGFLMRCDCTDPSCGRDASLWEFMAEEFPCANSSLVRPQPAWSIKAAA